MADSISDGLTGKAPTSADEQPAQTEALFSAETLTVSKILFFGPDDEQNPVPALPAAPDPAAKPAAHYKPAAGGHPEPKPQADPPPAEPTIEQPAAALRQTPATAPAAAIASDGSNADAVVETKPGRRGATRPRKQATASVDGAAAEVDDTAETAAVPAGRARRTPAKKAASPARSTSSSATNSAAPSAAAPAEPPGTAATTPGTEVAPAKPARKPRTKKVAAANATTERGEVRAIVTVPAEAVSAAAEAATDSTSSEAVPMAHEIPPTDGAAPAETAPPVKAAKRAPAKPAPKRPAKKLPTQQAPADELPTATDVPATDQAEPQPTAADVSPAENIEPVTPALVGDRVLEGTVLDAPAAAETPADTEASELAAATVSPVFAVLAAEPFISLTTFRKSGTPVPTPVWVAPDGDTLLVWTGAESGKVKRLRHTPGVTVAPCDRQGRLLGDPVPATARVLPPEELTRVKTAMTEKYGWQFRMSAAGATLGRFLRIAPQGQIALEIVLE